MNSKTTLGKTHEWNPRRKISENASKNDGGATMADSYAEKQAIVFLSVSLAALATSLSAVLDLDCPRQGQPFIWDAVAFSLFYLVFRTKVCFDDQADLRDNRLPSPCYTFTERVESILTWFLWFLAAAVLKTSLIWATGFLLMGFTVATGWLGYRCAFPGKGITKETVRERKKHTRWLGFNAVYIAVIFCIWMGEMTGLRLPEWGWWINVTTLYVGLAAVACLDLWCSVNAEMR